MSAVTSLLHANSPDDPETSQQLLPLLSNELLKLASEYLAGSLPVSPISCNGRPHNPEAIAEQRKDNTGQTFLAPDIC